MNNGVTNGAYELKLARVPRAVATGKPAQASITLRADAQAYQTFPGGLRTALPIDLSGATFAAGAWVASGPLTALKLTPLTGGGAAFIHGSIAAARSTAGALTVAEPSPGGAGIVIGPGRSFAFVALPRPVFLPVSVPACHRDGPNRCASVRWRVCWSRMPRAVPR